MKIQGKNRNGVVIRHTAKNLMSRTSHDVSIVLISFSPRTCGVSTVYTFPARDAGSNVYVTCSESCSECLVGMESKLRSSEFQITIFWSSA